MDVDEVFFTFNVESASSWKHPIYPFENNEIHTRISEEHDA